MEIIFKKGTSKNTITCKRPDGTSTWMEAEPFIITHDLTHYVVETNLDLKNGFYGLLSRGWDITDFEKKQKIKPSDIPREGIKAEILVGLLLTERSDQKVLDDFDSVYGDSAKKFQLMAETFDVNLLNQMRKGITELTSNWKALPAGESLVFNFPAE